MKKNFVILLLTIAINTFGQTKEIVPFKLVIIRPDTAIIDVALYKERDMFEAKHKKMAYECLSPRSYSKDSLKTRHNSISDLPKNIPVESDFIKDPEIESFKYYHLISQYSTAVYSFLFNTYMNNSRSRVPILEVPNQKVNHPLLKKLAQITGADYIIYFQNVHTLFQDSQFVLNLSTFLYSRKKNKIIFKTTTEGDTINRGMQSEFYITWTCDPSNRISCLFINGIRTSNEEILDVLKKLQFQK